MRRVWDDRVDFVLVEHQKVSDYPYPQPFLLRTLGGLEWVRQKEGFQPHETSFSLEGSEAQVTFDALWIAGFRPTEKINEASKLAATERHLDDMRAIAFSKLKVEQPTGDRK
jgi:hypothetical protein